tara:strand:+ start:363 stop:722 length:360 start_codon:yes stop_codon:yes gene_type:complete
MSKRATGEYFSIFTSKNAAGNQPTQDGKLQVNAEMLEAITDIARSQQMNGDPIEIDIGLGFWVQVAKESGIKYLRGRPSIFVSDEVEESLSVLSDYAERTAPPAAPPVEGSFDDNEIPF